MDAGGGPDTLLWKAVMIVAVYGCLRRLETTYIEWENVKLNRAGTGFLISGVMRRKQVGPARPSTFAITDPVSVMVLKKYIGVFQESERTGRFFRKLSPSLSGDAHSVGTKKVIGINLIGRIPFFIALHLGLPREIAIKFTGHAFRITGKDDEPQKTEHKFNNC